MEGFMKLNLRRSFVALLILFIPLENILHVSDVGYSYTKDITHHRVTVSAGDHPVFLLWALGCLVFFSLLLKRKERFSGFRVPSMWRRFWAFVLDSLFCLMV